MNADSLWSSILQAAIQGKLVPQDPNEEPVSVVIKKIRSERNNIFNEFRCKKKQTCSNIIHVDGKWYDESDVTEELDVPCVIPDTWTFVYMSDIGSYRKGPFGSSLTKSMFVPKGNGAVKVYEQKNAIQKDHTLGEYYILRSYYESEMQSFTVYPGDILVSCAGTIGETYQLPEDIEPGIINQALMIMRIVPCINIQYFLLYFDYILKKESRKKSNGSVIKNIPPFEIFKKMLVPVPPLAEQKRIVAKLEELKPLVERYGRYQTRLSELNASIGPLLKKSILQAAIQGKLVPQDPNESSTLIVDMIDAEKSRLVSEGKIKDRGMPQIFKRDGHWYEHIGRSERCIDEEISFDVPSNWLMVRQGSVLGFVNGKSYDVNELVPENKGKYKLIRVGNLFTSNSWLYTATEHDESQYCYDGDLIYGWSMSIGPYIWRGDKAIYVQHIWKIIFGDYFDPKYLYYSLLEDSFELKLSKHGSTMQHVTLKMMEARLCCIPPLAEQKRIVAKIEELYAIIDDL